MNKKQIQDQVNQIITHYPSKYISYNNLKQKTGMKKGQLSHAIKKLKRQKRIERRTRATWEIKK